MARSLNTTISIDHPWGEAFTESDQGLRPGAVPVAFLLDPAKATPRGGVFVRFDEELQVGRDPEFSGSVLQLQYDPHVSRNHARVFARDGYFEIVDLGSTNGTVVDGERIRGARRVAMAGSLLFMGDQGLLLQFVSDSAMRCLVEEQRNPFLAQATRCADLAEVHSRLGRLMQRMAPILLRGPHGAGKRYYARAIHEKANSCGRLLNLNCGKFRAMDLAEAECKFVQILSDCDVHTTLVLEELQTLPASLQTRIFSSEARARAGRHSIGSRVVATESAEPWRSGVDDCIPDHVAQGFEIVDLPALDYRREDITVLAKSLIKSDIMLSASVIRILCRLSWPGNISQLTRFVRACEASAIARAAAELGILDLPVVLGGLAEGAQESEELLRNAWSPRVKRSDVTSGSSEEALRRLADEFVERHQLSDREGEIVWLAARGKSDKEIASDLDRSYRTVRTHWGRICRKTGSRCRDGVIAKLLFFVSGEYAWSRHNAHRLVSK